MDAELVLSTRPIERTHELGDNRARRQEKCGTANQWLKINVSEIGPKWWTNNEGMGCSIPLPFWGS